MKTESPKLAEQRETRKSAETDLEFSFWFSIGVLMCLFIGFVFTGLHLVWDSFSELTLKLELQLLTIFTLSWLVLPLVFTLSCLQAFKPELSPSFHQVLEGGTHPFLVVPHLCRRFDPLVFFYSFLIILVIHLWMADLQWVLWPDSSAVSWLFHRFSLCFFFFSFFLYSLLPRN